MKLWVIGGTSGIGEAIANVGRKVGDQVYVTGTDFDVRSIDRLEHFYELNRGFDAVVYSAGINQLSWIQGLAPAEAMNILDVNVGGFMRLLRVVATHDNRAESVLCRSVVAISSDAATRPMRTSMAYCASKAALDMAVRCAARELAPVIRVNAVSPGMIAGTGMTEYIDDTVPALRGWTQAKTDFYEVSQSPIGRRGTVDEIARVTYNVLMGPDFLTGAVIQVNGGR